MTVAEWIVSPLVVWFVLFLLGALFLFVRHIPSLVSACTAASTARRISQWHRENELLASADEWVLAEAFKVVAAAEREMGML